jgi:hypothetical protein
MPHAAFSTLTALIVHGDFVFFGRYSLSGSIALHSAASRLVPQFTVGQIYLRRSERTIRAEWVRSKVGRGSRAGFIASLVEADVAEGVVFSGPADGMRAVAAPL